MASNPFSAMIPAMAPKSTEETGALATVTSLEPIRVLLDTDTDPVEATPLSLVRGLSIGDRVYLTKYRRKFLVVGPLQPVSARLDETHNLNSFTKTGTWYVLGNGHTSLSRGYPVEAAGHLDVVSLGSGYAVQEYTTWATASGSPRRYVRQYYGSTWRNWAEIDTTTEWTNLTLVNGWSNFGSGYAFPQYRREGDTVRLRGVLTGSTATSTVATLPSALRPAFPQLLGVTAWTTQAGPYRLNVSTSGAISFSGLSSSPSWITLDGITFPLS